MLLVVDVNVIFSALVNKGESFRVFEINPILKKFEFIVPEFLFSEIGKRMDKLLLQTKLTKEQLAESFSFIKEQLKPISYSEFIDKIPEAAKINIKDAHYLALASKFKCCIFSGDKGLKKQTLIKIYSPREILNILESSSSIL